MAASSTTCMTMLVLCAMTLLLTVQATDEHKGNSDLVTQACRNASSISFDGPPDFNMTREFCELTLRSDKRSAVAKYPRDLTLIAIDLVQRTAADALAKVDEQLGHNKNNHTAISLQYCHMQYTIIAKTVPVCRSLVPMNKPNHLASPRDFDCLSKLMSASEDCKGHLANDEDVRNALWSLLMEVYNRTILYGAMLCLMMFPNH